MTKSVFFTQICSSPVHERLYTRSEKPVIEKGLSFKPQINQNSVNILKKKEARSKPSSRGSSPGPKDYDFTSSYKINTSLGGFISHQNYVNSLNLGTQTKYLLNQLNSL